MIVIKSEHELKLMREAGKVCAEIFKGLEDLIKPGITTKDIDDYVEAVTEKHGMRAAEKGYCGYPASVCTSVNDEVVHGIPSKKRKLQEGDIVSCDLVIDNKGYMADACRTYAVGTVDDEARRLMETAEKAFFEGIKYAKVGYRLRDVSKAVQKTVEGEGFGVIRDFVGHGIGTEMHEDPQIPNYVCPGPNPRLQKGMTLCIEPMITEGDWEVEILDDDWTAVTTDGGWAAHYENTIVITDGEPEIITL
jgi:methionyl aminopeptidase